MPSPRLQLPWLGIRSLKVRFPIFFPIFIPNIFPSLAWLTYYEFTWLPTRIFLWSTIPQVAMPIKWTCWALSLNWAPRDMTVWPRTASPTWRMTPVFVPPVMIQAPVVSAAYKHKVIVLWRTDFYKLLFFAKLIENFPIKRTRYNFWFSIADGNLTLQITGRTRRIITYL